MDILLRALGPGVHCYLPFRTFENRSARKIAKLQELCKNTILKYVTLRRFLLEGHKLRLPSPILWYMTVLSTLDFEEIECAPFFDDFSLNFFHRALTYRVYCILDNQEYMVMYGYSPCEESWVETLHLGWVEMQHENIMCVCALVLDPVTNNIFYLFDKPNVSLVQICNVLEKQKNIFPEVLLWKLVIDLTSALIYILSCGLHYGSFGMNNVFVLKGRVVLENCLTRKCWRSKATCNQHLKPVIWDYDESEREALWCLKSLTKEIITEKCIPYYSKSLRDLFHNERWPNTLDDVREFAYKTMADINSPSSFDELVNCLQHSFINDETLSMNS